MTAALVLSVPASFASNENDTAIVSQSKAHASAYIGEVGKSVIQSGNHYRLKSRRSYNDHYVNEESVTARIKFWHDVALDTVALDHTPADGEGAPVNQGGPTRTSRALAMVQTSVFEALNSIENGFRSYTGYIGGYWGASPDAAVAFASYRTLKRLYPDQAERLREILDEETTLIKEGTSRFSYRAGKRLGKMASRQVIRARKGDRSRKQDPSFGAGGEVADGKGTYTGNRVNDGVIAIGEWEPDPNTPEESGDSGLALGAYWGRVKPFFLEAGNQFRAPVPPAIDSADYADAFNQVANIGGAQDNVNTPSTATDASRFVGNYWGYDGVPLIGVPPRVYNQIAVQIGAAEIDDSLELARYLALVNVAMADSAIAAWDSKFFYNLWRPVTGIRIDDGNDGTVTDEQWNPVGVSVVNTSEAIRPTPPFPAYPSGHAAFGGATFEVLRSFFGDIAFTFVSDEFNGEGFDPFFPDVPRPFVPVRFESLSDAQAQNGISRVYNGVHWNFDDTAGQEMGVNVARFLLDEVTQFQRRNHYYK